jgi:hypothetical protein
MFFPAADTIAFSEGGVEAMRIDGSGNLGIGTTSPATKLNVVGSISASDSTNVTKRLQLDVGASSGTINCANYGSDMMDLNIQGENLLFNTGLVGVAERMRIDSSGNLLVGRTSQFGFEKVGITYAGNLNWGLGLNDTFSNASANTAIQFNKNGNNVGSITTTNSATAYVTSSDYRLKENIVPMAGALNLVQQLKPVTYDWKVGGSSQGFIAHELAEVCPEAVSGEKDAVNEDGSIKPQGIDTSFLVATLAAAIQELKAELDSVKAKLAVLKA